MRPDRLTARVELRNDNGVSWPQLNVLLRVLLLEHLFVIELVIRLPAAFVPQHEDLFAFGVLLHAAGGCDQLKNGRRSDQRIRSRLLDLTSDEDLAAVDLFDDDARGWILDVSLGLLDHAQAQLLRGETARLNVVQQ